MLKVFVLTLFCYLMPRFVSSEESITTNPHPQNTQLAKVYLYGLERSGTNILEKLLTLNFKIKLERTSPVLNGVLLQESPFHKHFKIFDEKHLISRDVHINNHIINSLYDLDTLLKNHNHTNKYLVIYKNVFSWLPSMTAFVNPEAPQTKMNFLDEYIAYRKKWNDIKNDRVLMINYEELIQSNEVSSPIWQKILKFLSRKRSFKNKKNLFFPHKVFMSPNFNKKRLNYYRKKEYLNLYTEEERAIIEEKMKEAGLSID